MCRAFRRVFCRLLLNLIRDEWVGCDVCRRDVYTHTPCRTHIFFAHFPCVTYRHRAHAWLKVFAVCMSYLSALSILMFHPSSMLSPHGHFDTTFPSAPSSSSFTRPRSAGQAHVRTSAREFGYLADPTHSTGYEPKEFDKTTSVDGDTTPINGPNNDSISDFSKNTRQNTGLFGGPTMFETSVSHVSHGNFALQRGSQESMHWETVAGQREREEREGSVISVAESMSRKSRRNSF